VSPNPLRQIVCDTDPLISLEKITSGTDSRIRAARASDAEELSDLAFHSKAYWEYSAAFMEACCYELTYTPGQIESDHFRFAVGEAGAEREGFNALEQRSPTDVELKALSVRPVSIGKGYGRALVEDAKHEAAEIGAKLPSEWPSPGLP